MVFFLLDFRTVPTAWYFFLLDFRTVPTAWYFFSSFYDIVYRRKENTGTFIDQINKNENVFGVKTECKI